MKSNKRIFFRADADAKIGYGHFIRTLALADMLKDDFDCVFFTSDPTEYQRNEVAKVCRLVALPADNGKFDGFLEYLTGSEIVFLDNYFYTPTYEKIIKAMGCKLVVLSPSKPRHYADIVVNYIDKDPTHYSVEPYTRIVAGLEWVILREPFRQPIQSNSRQKGSVIISFGGTDQFCLTEKAVQELGEKKCQISVIFTSRVSEERRQELKNQGIQVYTDISAEDVASLFEQSEFAILSSSTVCLEALSRGTKVLAGYYVDNQVNFYHVLMEEHCITGLGNLMEDGCFMQLKALMGKEMEVKLLAMDFNGLRERYVSLFNSLC